MSDEESVSSDKLRAVRHAEQRAKRHEKAEEGPVVARYGVWTGEGYLRAGEGLEKQLAEKSVKVDGATRREKRRKKK